MVKKIKSLLFQNLTTRQTVAKNTFWLAVSNIGGRSLRAFVIVYAARLLGAEGWGIFSYALTFVAFITIFADMGISYTVAREVSKTKDVLRRSEILSTAFWLKTALLAVGVFVVIFIAPRFTVIQAAKNLLPITSLVLIFDTLRDFGFSVIRGLEKMELETGLFMLTNLAIVAFGFAFLYFSPTVLSFTLSYVAGASVGAIATLFVVKKFIAGLFSKFSRRLIKQILTSTWPFAISGILGLFMLNADIIILGWLRSAEEVGFYSAANRIIQLLYILPTILAVSILPTFSRLASQDNKKMRLFIERTMTLLLLTALPMASGGIILGKEIMTLVFGVNYAPGAASFQILMATLAIDFSALILSYAIFSYDRRSNLVVYSAIGGVTNVVLDLLLIPKFGITGSAWATFAAQLLSNIYLWRTMKAISYFHVLPYLGKILISTAIMSIASLSMLSLGLNTLVIIGVSVLIYFGCLYLLKEPVLKEIKQTFQPRVFSQEKTIPVVPTS